MHRVTINAPAEVDDGVPKGPNGVTGVNAPAENAAARYAGCIRFVARAAQCGQGDPRVTSQRSVR
jgi:hypothetical protein